MDELIVTTSQEQTTGREIDIGALVDRRLFKTLSLLLAKSAGVRIPNTLLLLAANPDAVHEVWRQWTRPLILRVDFTELPKRKVLGGIAVSHVDRLIEICDWLRANSYVPLVHSFIDRYRNLYSAGVLMSSDDKTLNVEAVGPGFDAGELRLGTALPHEVFKIAARHETSPTSSIISHERYVQERHRRLTGIARLRSYTDYVEENGTLLADLKHFPVDRSRIAWASSCVPERYVPMPVAIRRKLCIAAARVQAEVIPSLPSSPTSVASFSYLKEHGWLLWDVYGHWYVR